jgi:ribosomal-protein-serine acetyltransferase
MEEQPNLVSGQVLLRPYRADDAADLYTAARESITEVSPWMKWCHPDYAIEESRTWTAQCVERWREGTEYNFVIADPRDGSFLGGCGLNNINLPDNVANLGYWVRTSQTRQGIATTATRLLTRFGLEELRLNRIEIIAATDNQASQRVAEKAGAVREGILRNRLVVHENVYDMVIYSFVPHDLKRLLD